MDFFLNCQNPDVSFYALLDQLLGSKMILDWYPEVKTAVKDESSR